MTITKSEFERRKAIEYAYYIKDKEIEILSQFTNEWEDCYRPNFGGWGTCDYRIKQEPKSELEELEKIIDDPQMSSFWCFKEILKQLKRLEKNQDNTKK